MNNRFLSFAALGLCATLLAGCPSPAQKSAPVGRVITPTAATNYTSKVAGFSIYFPTPPTESKKSGTESWGSYETYIYQAEASPITYIVVAMTVPSTVDTSDTSHFIDGIQEGQLKEAKAKLIKSEDVTLNGLSGRELTTSMLDDKAGSRVAIYVTPKISYQIMAVGLKGEIGKNSAQINKVFSSFKIAESFR